jgi:hypothetical protein
MVPAGVQHVTQQDVPNIDPNNEDGGGKSPTESTAPTTKLHRIPNNINGLSRKSFKILNR